MNSDFSPYQGQQHEAISQNLQAAAINKMVTGNRGELGKASLPNDMRNAIKSLARQEDKVYRAYEALANKIINRVAKNAMKETGTVQGGGLTQNLQNCFRCATVGSTNTNRLQTNTYIPSYVLDANLVNQARNQLPNKYKDFIVVETAAGPDEGKGYVQIYTSAFGTLMDKFEEAANQGIVYQLGVWKNTLATMPDATQFKKRTATNSKDNGKYAATQALYTKAKQLPGGCAQTCLNAEDKVWSQASGNPDCGQGTSTIVSDLGTGVTLGQCKDSCVGNIACTDITWAPGNYHCILFAGCDNAGSSTGWRRYVLQREALKSSAPIMPPIKQDSSGTSVTGACAGCALLFKNLKQNTRPAKPVPPTQPPPPVSGIVQTGTGQEIVLPDLEGADTEVPDYPDSDGSPREGRPSDAPTTTTSYPIVIVYRTPAGGSGLGIGGSAAGVVGAASSSWLHGSLLMLLAAVFCCSS
jgi:hypothetical protein